MRWEKLTNKEKEEENMKQKDPVVYWSLFIELDDSCNYFNDC